MRANLDLLLDWAYTVGLGEVALEHTHTLSSATNLLATPRKNLLQVKHTHSHKNKHFTFTRAGFIFVQIVTRDVIG